MDLDGLCLQCMQGRRIGGVCDRCGCPADFAQTQPNALAPGSILHGCYLLGRTLGAGGFGVTYLALHIPSGRRVAVKEFLPADMAHRGPDGHSLTAGRDQAQFTEGRARFLKEAQTIYSLRGHPGLVSVEKLFQENNTAYYAMEFLDGCDLKQHTKRLGGRIPFDQVTAILSPVLDTLAYIHDMGVIHRDISPDNIFICGDGSIKLIDFGAAYAAMRESSTDIQLVVKNGFAPMEQYITKGRLGPWSDLYAFCCTAYYCLTGTVPPDAPTRNINDPLAPPSRLGAALPPGAERALLKGMSVRSQERYFSAGELKEALFGANAVSRAVEAAPSAPADSGGAWTRMTQALKGWLTKGMAASGRCPGQALALRSASGLFCGCVFPIGQSPVRIGRDATQCGLVFPDNAGGVSRVHCQVYTDLDRGVMVVADCMSTFGTQIIDGPLLKGGTMELGVGAGFLVGREMFIVTLA